MYLAAAVSSIQGKSRFTVPEGELLDFTVAEGAMFLSHKNSTERLVGY